MMILDVQRSVSDEMQTPLMLNVDDVHTSYAELSDGAPATRIFSSALWTRRLL